MDSEEDIPLNQLRISEQKCDSMDSEEDIPLRWVFKKLLWTRSLIG